MNCARVAAAVVALAIGCDPGQVSMPDGGIGDAGGVPSDAGDGGHADGSAFEIEWRTAPKVPDSAGGPWRPQFELARFDLTDVRVVGDVGVLAAATVELEFSDDDKPATRFEPAAPGRYATVLGRIAYVEIRGSLDVGGELGGERVDFVIEDRPPPQVGLALALGDAEVKPGETKRVRIRFDLRALVDAVDWDAVDNEDGTLELESDGPQIEAFRTALAGAIRLE